MISEKMKAFTQNSSQIRAMFEEGKRLSAIYGAEHVYDYSIGNPCVPPPETVKESIYRILDTEAPNFVHGYTNNSGYEDVRQAVCNAVNKEFGARYTPDCAVMTNGAAGGLNILLKTLLNPGDEVIVFAPYFGEYRSYVQNYDGILVTVKPEPPAFQICFDDLEKKLSQKTAAVIINSPNNPTGVVYSEETLTRLAALLSAQQKKSGRPIYLISDEPYRRIVFDGVKIPYVSHYYKNTFIAYSYSKALSLPGERIGYLLANPEMDGFSEIMNALNVANRILGFVNAPSLFQRILPDVVSDSCDMRLYETNRNLLYAMLTEIGFSVQKPQGAFYMFPQSLIKDDMAFCNAAKDYRLLIVPGSSFGCPGYFRLSFCIPEQNIKNSRDSFQKLYQQFKGASV